MGTQSSILAWRMPWREEPGGLQSTGLQKHTHMCVCVYVCVCVCVCMRLLTLYTNMNIKSCFQRTGLSGIAKSEVREEVYKLERVGWRS